MKLTKLLYLSLYIGNLCLSKTINIKDLKQNIKEKYERQTINQKMSIANNSECACLAYFGKALIDCLACKSKHEVRKTFTRMNVYKKRAYLMSMNIRQYYWFLDAFTEQQWKSMLRNLDKDEQKQLPDSKLVQLKMIRDTWLECSSGDRAHYAHGSKDPYARDLKAWRKKTMDKSMMDIEDNTTRTHTHTSVPTFYSWVEHRFAFKKACLFAQKKEQA